jgi:hypothetical protein
MKKSIQLTAVFLLILSNTTFAEKHDNPCPSELVNFWKNYAVNTDNYSAIPEFLLRNECFRARVSTEFHKAMVNRFDYPEDPRFVDQLFAQLDWSKNTSASR